MAIYFPTSSSQRDSVPMLYLREPMSTTYAETPVLPGNAIMYMNYPSSSGSYTDTLAGNSNQPNSCIDIPTVGVADCTASQQEFLSNIGESRIGENGFGSWRDGRNEMVFMHPMSGQNLQGQGLSLSLSPQITPGVHFHSIQYRNHNPGFSSFLSPNSSVSGDGREDENSQSKQSRNSDCALPGFPGSNSDSMKTDGSPYGMSNISRTISSSKYLKAAQQLLDEVVNVRKALKQHDSRKELMKDSKELDGESKNGSSSNPQDSVTTSTNELSAAEKQDLQNKMTKLLSMLDEVDRRYKQYYHQMQIVVSSFDVIAGCGSAKPYTALALQTISRHFRCLRDAINGQIKVTQRNLGEPDASANSKGVGISRLRYVDQQLRQQRALQQLGMINQHTWRPQRGLPESSVSILRAWLFEHFLHPYPKDSDKIMLARQTGLTRSQVSNWFINARVRLWKPMVEEMYKEEAGDVEMEYNSSSEIAPRSAKGDIKASGDGGADPRQSAASTATEQCSTGQFFDSKSNLARDVEMAGASTDTDFHNAGQGDQRASMDDCNLFADTMAAYQLSELGRFGNGSGVSLTLGLQHCEVGGNMPMSLGTHQSFVTMRADDVYNAGPSSVGPETTEFDCMDSGNRQQRFGSSHLLHDFVA